MYGFFNFTFSSNNKEDLKNILETLNKIKDGNYENETYINESMAKYLLCSYGEIKRDYFFGLNYSITFKNRKKIGDDMPPFDYDRLASDFAHLFKNTELNGTGYYMWFPTPYIYFSKINSNELIIKEEPLYTRLDENDYNKKGDCFNLHCDTCSSDIEIESYKILNSSNNFIETDTNCNNCGHPIKAELYLSERFLDNLGY